VAKRWILDTETKGTGAQMVPLDKTHDGDAASARAPIVVREARPAAAPEPEQRGPRRFKVVDVMTRQVLAEDVDLRKTVEVLAGMRSVVDVNVYIWDENSESWQQLSQGDRRRLWALRERVGG